MTKGGGSGKTLPFARKDADEQVVERELGQWKHDSARADRGDWVDQYGSGLPGAADAGAGGDDSRKRTIHAAGREGCESGGGGGQAGGERASDRASGGR